MQRGFQGHPGQNTVWPKTIDMKDRYQQALDAADANDAWKGAPVAFEACGVMQRWADEGYDVEFIFNEALRWRCSTRPCAHGHTARRFTRPIKNSGRKRHYRLSNGGRRSR